MARVVAYIPDLLFGSQVQGALRAAGHEVELVADQGRLPDALTSADVLVVDLTNDAASRARAVKLLLDEGGVEPIHTVAFYSHVETDTRALAERLGFGLVVPRSRVAREGAELVGRLVGM